MKSKTIQDLQEEYDLELERVVKTIKKEKPKRVLLQFPDGLKPWATAIKDKLQEEIGDKVELFIWFDSCFGACDVPTEVEKLGIDLVIQFGHSAWDFNKESKIKVIK